MQIANIIVNDQVLQSPVDQTTLVPTYARQNEAAWHESSMPEIGRTTCVYTRRPPVKGTELTKHTFRFTIPTLKSLVTDPSGPYTPTPAVDYVTVAEIAVWVHPRSTSLERERAITTASSGMLTASMQAIMFDTIRLGNTLF